MRLSLVHSHLLTYDRQTSRLDAVKAESTRPSSSDRVPSRTQIVTIKSDPAATSTSTTTARPSAAATQSHAPLTQPIGRPGHSYPGVHISSLDPNGPIPLFAPLNKPLTDLDFDADLTEHDKSWRRPGADQSDWFNYGFDEFTWATYCLRQKSMREGIEGQKAETARFETMFGGGPGPGQGGRDGSAVPGQGAQMQGVPDMGMGMPDMNAMMQQMMASGMDPSTMDFGGFMQMQQQQQQQQGMGMGMGGPQQGGGFGGDGGHGGGGFGRGGGRRGRRW